MMGELFEFKMDSSLEPPPDNKQYILPQPPLLSKEEGSTVRADGLLFSSDYKDDDGYDSLEEDDDDNEDGEGRSKKKSRGLHSSMTDEQKIERR
jgi:hypothetical protein